MTDVIHKLAEPRRGKTPRSPLSAISASDAHDAVLQTFPFEGELRIRHLWSNGNMGKYRANWYRVIEGELRVAQSRFLCIEKTNDGLIVRDETARS